MDIIGIFIIFFGVINLIRITAFIVGSDIYSYRDNLGRSKRIREKSYPHISIIVPAHNEEKTILRAVQSIIRSKYPRYKREVVVVDDGSVDRTSEIVKRYRNSYRVKNLKIIHQNQRGKARALNNGIKNHSRGELVMCLDSDSYLSPDSLKKIAYYFKEKKVVAVSANVKIIPARSLLNLIQRFEYIISYQMKRAHTIFNIEYIIGGVGSTFRRNVLKRVNYYDSNTITEDIDLTMKILQLGNKDFRVIYAAEVIAYTESVLNIKELIQQRFRWKLGRTQTFIKNLNMFFNRDKKFTKGLTFVYLPFAIFSDIAFLLEPIIISYIFYVIIRYGDIFTLASAIVVVTFYITLNIVREQTIDSSEKRKYLLLAPFMYLLFYLLSFVEYVALVRTIFVLPNLKKSLAKKIHRWDHVDRLGLKRSLGFSTSKTNL